jgi:acyl carrier protein
MNPKLPSLLAPILDLSLSDIVEDLSQDTCATWDSLATINLAIALEAEFDIALMPEEIANMKSIAAVQSILDRHLKA